MANVALEERTSLLTSLQDKSGSLSDYFNNLDSLLRIETVVSNVPEGLQLLSSKLYISDNWHWLLVDKHKTESIFKIVGISKTSREDLVYILGRTSEKGTFLTRIDSKYLETASLKKCIKSVKERKPLPRWVKPTIITVVSLTVLGALIYFVILPWIVSTNSILVEVITTVPTTEVDGNSSAGEGIIDILPIVFAATVILVVVKSLGSVD